MSTYVDVDKFCFLSSTDLSDPVVVPQNAPTPSPGASTPRHLTYPPHQPVRPRRAFIENHDMVRQSRRQFHIEEESALISHIKTLVTKPAEPLTALAPESFDPTADPQLEPAKPMVPAKATDSTAGPRGARPFPTRILGVAPIPRRLPNAPVAPRCAYVPTASWLAGRRTGGDAEEGSNIPSSPTISALSPRSHHQQQMVIESRAMASTASRALRLAMRPPELPHGVALDSAMSEELTDQDVLLSSFPQLPRATEGPHSGGGPLGGRRPLLAERHHRVRVTATNSGGAQPALLWQAGYSRSMNRIDNNRVGLSGQLDTRATYDTLWAGRRGEDAAYNDIRTHRVEQIQPDRPTSSEYVPRPPSASSPASTSPPITPASPLLTHFESVRHSPDGMSRPGTNAGSRAPRSRSVVSMKEGVSSESLSPNFGLPRRSVAGSRGSTAGTLNRSPARTPSRGRGQRSDSTWTNPPMDTLTAIELSAVADFRIVSRLAEDALGNLGYTEEKKSFTGTYDKLPSRSTYPSLHPLSLIKEIPLPIDVMQQLIGQDGRGGMASKRGDQRTPYWGTIPQQAPNLLAKVSKGKGPTGSPVEVTYQNASEVSRGRMWELALEAKLPMPQAPSSAMPTVPVATPRKNDPSLASSVQRQGPSPLPTALPIPDGSSAVIAEDEAALDALLAQTELEPDPRTEQLTIIIGENGTQKGVPTQAEVSSGPWGRRLLDQLQEEQRKRDERSDTVATLTAKQRTENRRLASARAKQLAQLEVAIHRRSTVVKQRHLSLMGTNTSTMQTGSLNVGASLGLMGSSLYRGMDSDEWLPQASPSRNEKGQSPKVDAIIFDANETEKEKMSAIAKAKTDLLLHRSAEELFAPTGGDTEAMAYPSFPFESERAKTTKDLLTNIYANAAKAEAARKAMEKDDGKTESFSSHLESFSHTDGALAGSVRAERRRKERDEEEAKKELERAVVARKVFLNRRAFDLQDDPAEDWKKWKRSAEIVALAKADGDGDISPQALQERMDELWAKEMAKLK